MSAEFAPSLPIDDTIEHERTYETFVHLLAIVVFHLLSIVVALAIGGVEGRWFLALFWIAAAIAAAVVGLVNKRIGWKLSATVLGLAVVSLI
ncbi:MAG: aa3-type cytochrome c oxidase subunit IV [Beijerinckiaceae bacterium]|nr:aa3-type cytochrome c oxidase subunit IV [Beijerinckiaceae bacterium]